jgi:hypothetical protein
MMQSGPIPKVIRGVGTLLRTITKNAASIDSENARLTSRLLDSLRAGGGSDRQGSNLLREKTESIARVRTAVASRIGQLEAEINGIAQDLMAKLEADLRERVAAFGKAQSADFLQRQKQPSRASWRCNTLPLRSELEAALSETLADLQAKLGALQERAAQDLNATSGRASSALGAAIEGGPLPFRQLSPALGPLSEMVAVDPDSPVWPQWWAKPMSPDERAEHLREVIGTEFGTIIEKLTASAKREAGELAASILGHFRVVMLAPLESWSETLDSLAEAAHGENAATVLESHLASYRKRQEEYQAVTAALQSGAV